MCAAAGRGRRGRAAVHLRPNAPRRRPGLALIAVLLRSYCGPTAARQSHAGRCARASPSALSAPLLLPRALQRPLRALLRRASLKSVILAALLPNCGVAQWRRAPLRRGLMVARLVSLWPYCVAAKLWHLSAEWPYCGAFKCGVALLQRIRARPFHPASLSRRRNCTRAHPVRSLRGARFRAAPLAACCILLCLIAPYCTLLRRGRPSPGFASCGRAPSSARSSTSSLR